MASRNGKNSSGLRMLWIPGRKAHPKGRFDSTSKHISYSTRQKKSEVWSLGGSRNQRDLLEADPDTSLLDGPSTSGLSSIACAAGTTAVAVSIPVADSTKCLLLDAQNTESNTDTLPSAASTQKNNSSENQKPAPTSPTTPNSTTSTAPLLSPPQSPLQQQNETVTITTTTTVTEQPSSSSETLNKMPAKAHQPIPVMVTTTTSAEIMDENRFTLLGKDNITINEFDIYSLPSPPTNPLNSNEHLNSSSGTTASQISSAAGSPQKDGHNNNYHSNNATNSIDSRQLNGSVNSTPVKSKHHHRNHNNNQADVNSIESITEDVTSDKIPATDNLDWIDNMVQDHNDRVILQKPSKKKKNKHATTRQLDQLDGVPHKDTKDASMHDEEEGDKMVKCLYYTLMCCDCSIS